MSQTRNVLSISLKYFFILLSVNRGSEIQTQYICIRRINNANIYIRTVCIYPAINY